MHNYSVLPHDVVFGSFSFQRIAHGISSESNMGRRFPSLSEKNPYLISDGIETMLEVEAALSDLLGDEVWIPYDLADQIKKFPWLFDPNDRRFTYVQRVCNEDCTYDLNTIECMNSDLK